jgi:hypothetical protein
MAKTGSVVLLCGVLASGAIGQCQNPVWSPEFGGAGAGLSSSGFAIHRFDRDGPGGVPEELFVGGAFQNARGRCRDARDCQVEWVLVDFGGRGSDGNERCHRGVLRV